MNVPRFSIFALLGFITIASIYAALMKLFGLQTASIMLISVCAAVVSGLAAWLFFSR